MVYSSSSYTPAYYSSFQDTITSLCKSILLPFSKNRRLPADQAAARRHAESLKWQQESFHRILHLIGLHREGIVAESEVSAFRIQLLDTLIASPAYPEPAGVIRDKLLFLQELLYAKCISAEEYHSSKRPLLQRLAVLGVEIDCRDVVIGAPPTQNSEEEEWSFIDLRDPAPAPTADKVKHKTPIKSFISWKSKGKKESMNPPNRPPLSLIDQNAKKPTILMAESSPLRTDKQPEKEKRRPFTVLFHKEEKSGNENREPVVEDMSKKKNSWGLKWKKGGGSAEEEDAAPCLASGERSDGLTSVDCKLKAGLVVEAPDAKRIKKVHSDDSEADFSMDKVLGENTKKELSRIQLELSSSTNPNLNFSNEQIEAISTRLPIDKSDLKNFFPKSWCDQHGDVVLDVVKKEFKGHIDEMEKEKQRDYTARETSSVGERWVAFEDNHHHNFHPNLFSQSEALLKAKPHESINNNPFWDPRDN